MQPKKREFTLLASGKAYFYVKWAATLGKDRQPLMSKSGLRMIKVTCNCTDKNQKSEDVITYFTESGLDYLGRLMDSVGIPSNYSPESIFRDPAILLGQEGECFLDHEESPEYGKRNRIAIFKQKLFHPIKNRLSPDEPVVPTRAESDDFDDTEIPF